MTILLTELDGSALSNSELDDFTATFQVLCAIVVVSTASYGQFTLTFQ